MTKLKCWKKVTGIHRNSIVLDKINTGEKIHLFTPQGEKKYYVRIKIATPKQFKTKKEALKFANKYMKSHDKC